MPMRVRTVMPSPACSAAQMPLRLWLINTTCQAMLARQRADVQFRVRYPLQRTLSNQLAITLCALRLPEQCHIKRVVIKRLEQRPVAINAGNHSHPRMVALELAKYSGHKRFAKIFLHTNTYFTL